MFRPLIEAPPPPGVRLFRLELGIFQGESDRPRSEQDLQILLDCLTDLNVVYMKAYPGRIPPLYKSGVVYTREPVGADERWQDAFTTWKRGNGDCLPEGTLIVKRGYQLCPIEDIQVGDEILDGEKWVRVLNWWDKGTLPVLSFQLNNGCVLRCTEEHRVFVVKRRGKGPGGVDDVEERRAGDVRPDDDLWQPDELPTGETAYGDDMSLLLGAYVADGTLYAGRDGVMIAGIPGGKGMRERCIAAARQLRFDTREIDSTFKGIVVHSPELRVLAEQCGGRAPVKHFPTIDVTRATAEQMLEGVNTDGTVQYRQVDSSPQQIFYSTSKQLVLQYRMLQRMFGRSVSIRVDENHSGFGSKVPLHIVCVRSNPKKRPWAKVKSVSLEEIPQRCYDIETESKRIYLPESDVIVHNCEDLACYRAAELRVAGQIARAFARGRELPSGGRLYHILVQRPNGVEDPSRILGMNNPDEGVRERIQPDLHVKKAFVPGEHHRLSPRANPEAPGAMAYTPEGHRPRDRRRG